MSESRPPFFSVLIAAYNTERFVAAALDSVMAQTWTDFEIVVVDDGSTDGTAAVVAGWLDRQSDLSPDRFTLLRTANRGQSAAFETGFERCRGRFIALLDADDRWAPTKLARSHQILLERPEAGAVVHSLAVIHPDGRPTGAIRPKAARLSDGDVAAAVRRTGRHVVGGSTAMVIRTEVFRSLMPFPTTKFPFAADAYLALGVCLATPLAAISEPLGDYRMHPGGQYVRRMLSPAGLGAQLEFQATLARHFGLEATVARNSQWGRNVFARARFDGGGGISSLEYRRLLIATLRDPLFRPVQRLALVGFWTVCAGAPRRQFERLWRWFQYRQTGYDLIAEAASHE